MKRILLGFILMAWVMTTFVMFSPEQMHFNLLLWGVFGGWHVNNFITSE